MSDKIEIHITLHWDGSEMGNRLYTLRLKSQDEYVPLLQRLAGYAFKEERIIVPGEISTDPKERQEEVEALEWRLKALNEIVLAALPTVPTEDADHKISGPVVIPYLVTKKD